MLCKSKHITVMDSCKSGLTMIEVIAAFPKVEVQNIYTEHLLHLLVLHAASDMFCDGLGYPIEHALEIVCLTSLLNFNKDNLTFGVLGLYVYTVVLGIMRFLIGFTLKQFYNMHFLLYKNGNKSLKYYVICLVAKYVLRCPVKPYVLVFDHLCSFLLFVLFFFFHSHLIFD